MKQRIALVFGHFLREASSFAVWRAAIATIACLFVVELQTASASPPPDIYSYRAQNLAELRRGFSQPTIEARPWAIWFWWNGVLQREEIGRQLQELADAGFGGAEIRCITFHGWWAPPLEHMDDASLANIGHRRVEYLSDEFLDLLEYTCETAKSLGLRLSLNMGQGWPPGGPWITDQHRSKLLSWTSHEVVGPSKLVEESLAANDFALAWRIVNGENQVAVDETSFVDLSDQMRSAQGGRTLRWNVPEGKWLVGVFRISPGAIADKGDGPEVDPASREAVLYHLNYFFGRLDPQLRRFYGETLVEIASDSWEYERGNKRYWSSAIVESFPKFAGYDLRRNLYALAGYGPDKEQVLSDLESVEQSLVRANFFSTVQQFLHERGLRHRPQVYGRGLSRDYLQAYALADVPEVEAGIVLPEAPWAARATGHPLVTAEAFTFLSTKHEPVKIRNGPDETTPALLRWHANHYFGQGINRLNMHSYSYSPPQLPLPGWKMYAEIHLNRTVPWWPVMPSVTTWMARNQWCLQAGEPVTETLVYPVESNPLEPPYNSRDDQPVSAGNGILGLNAATLPIYAESILQGKADPPENICIISGIESALEATLLLDLLGERGSLTYCGPIPATWTAMQSPQGHALSTRLKRLRDEGRLVDGRELGWRRVVEEKRAVKWPTDANLVYQHRRVADADVYFVVNYGEPFSGEVSFPQINRQMEIWSADTGKTQIAAECAEREDRTYVRCDLGHFESTLIVFSDAPNDAKPLRVISSDGGTFRIGEDGRIIGHFDQPGECHVLLSNDRNVAFDIDLPAPIPVTGPWELRVVTDLAVSEPVATALSLERLKSWRKIAPLRNFAGTAAYNAEFVLPKELVQADLLWQLELGQVFETARVWVNGAEAGVAWSPPFRLAVTPLLRPGKNTLRIEVANLLKNHLDRSPEYARPSGLLGPVMLAPQRERLIYSPEAARSGGVTPPDP